MRRIHRRNCIGAMILAAVLTLPLAACSDSADRTVLTGTETSTGSASGLEYLQSGNYESAIVALTEEAAGESGRTREETLRELGIAYMGVGNYADAAAVFEEALTNAGVIPSESEFDINYYLGSCYYKQGQYDQALQVYDAIVTLHPGEADAYVLRGAVYMALGSEEEMTADFEDAIAREPTNYDRIVTIYETMERGGYKEQGQTYLQETLDQYSSVMDNYDRGRFQYYLGNYEEAKSALEQIENRTYDTAILLGRAYEALGDMNFASSVYRTYLTQDSSRPEVYNQLGLCCIAMGDYEGALSAFQQGESLGESETTQSLAFNEIIAYEYLGEFSKAQTLMAEYLTRYPGDADAQRENIFLSTR